MESLDSPVALAMMAKAKLVFENEGTFLSFPLSTITYTDDQLRLIAQHPDSDEAVLQQSEFSQLVNLIPKGEIWPPLEQSHLWEIYDDVLKGAKLASSIRTAEEEADYQRAFQFLHRIREDGLREDTPPVTAYNQYRDSWFLAQQDYRVKKLEAENSTDPAVKQKWQHETEPALLENIANIERLWESNGFRSQVEEARRIEAALGAKQADKLWGDWARLFHRELDTLTDTNKFEFIPTSYSPANAFETGGWQKFTLTGDEATALMNQAPPALKARLNPNAVNLDIESLSFEYTSVVVTRSWFAPEVFKARFWRFYDSSQILSDGQNPPNGRLPAYIASIVFARNLEIKLKPQSAKNDAAMNQMRFNKALMLGAFKVAPPPPSPVGMQRPTLRSVRLAPPRATILARPALTVTPQPPPGQPIVRDHRTAAAPIVRDHRTGSVEGVRTFIPLKLNTNFIRLRDLTATIATPITPTPPPTEAPQPAPPTEQQTDDDEIIVLAFICKRLPQSPNPDLSLQWS